MTKETGGSAMTPQERKNLEDAIKWTRKLGEIPDGFMGIPELYDRKIWCDLVCDAAKAHLNNMGEAVTREDTVQHVSAVGSNTSPAISDEQRRAALDDMPDIVGTDENGALGRSKDKLLRWYVHYYSTIRTLLQAPSVDREVVEALEQMIEAINSGNIDSPEIGGEPEVCSHSHKWHEEWLWHAQKALSKLRSVK